MLRKEGMESPTRYHTQSILAVPILADDMMGESEDGKEIYGVVQLINKTEFDGQVLSSESHDCNMPSR